MGFDERLAILLCDEADRAARHVESTGTPITDLPSLRRLGARIVAMHDALDPQDATARRWSDRLGKALAKCNHALGAELVPVGARDWGRPG